MGSRTTAESRKAKVAESHEDEGLPPARAAAQAKREAALFRLLTTSTLFEKFKKLKRDA